MMSTATIQEPDSVVGDDELYEVIDGRRVRTPPMGVFAVWIASHLYRHLANFATAQHRGHAITEALFHLPAPVNRDRRPDVAFVSFQRWAKNRPIPRLDNAWDVVPNLTTEVVSPTDTAEELQQKIAEYFRVGVELVWVVYPMQSQIHVYSAPTQVAVLARADTLDGGSVLPGFRLALADLFVDADDPAATNGTAKP
jgi:Uma2 family endonuclease